MKFKMLLASFLVSVVSTAASAEAITVVNTIYQCAGTLQRVLQIKVVSMSSNNHPIVSEWTDVNSYDSFATCNAARTQAEKQTAQCSGQ